jgi:hypothetical protein
MNEDLRCIENRNGDSLIWMKSLWWHWRARMRNPRMPHVVFTVSAIKMVSHVLFNFFSRLFCPVKTLQYGMTNGCRSSVMDTPAESQRFHYLLCGITNLLVTCHSIACSSSTRLRYELLPLQEKCYCDLWTRYPLEPTIALWPSVSRHISGEAEVKPKNHSDRVVEASRFVTSRGYNIYNTSVHRCKGGRPWAQATLYPQKDSWCSFLSDIGSSLGT